MGTALRRYLRHHHLAFLALFVALGGTSYAALRIPANSVGTTQLRNKAVTLHKIETAAQIALRGQTGSVGPQGARGLAGLVGSPGKAGTPGTPGTAGTPGAAGTAGTPGIKGTTGTPGTPGIKGTNGTNGTNGATKVVVRTGSATVSAGPDQLGDAQANCNPGEHATGGGEFISPNSGSPDETIRFSAPSLQSSQFIQPASAGDVPDAWAVEVLNNAASSRLLYVYVVCASP